jgi:membrane-associated phospholipid phosphatase
VNLLDSYFTNIVGTDFAVTIQNIENGAVYWFSQHWTPVLLYFFVFIYIIAYPFLLWFSPLYFILTSNKKAISALALSLFFMYVIALPFYLFLPITNVYTFYGGESALEMVIPLVENFFYNTTTINNCFPSLHVAMAIIIAKSTSFTKNKKYIYFTGICAFLVPISVIYLSIHWLTDVLGGILLAFGAFYLQCRILQGK